MDINRENYEMYFIDYYDGNLNNNDIDTLMAFLQSNIDLKEEFEEFEEFSVSIPKVIYPNKNILLKRKIVSERGINADNCEDFFIAYHEGDLSEEEKIETLLFCEKNLSLKKEFQSFSKIFLTPDKAIRFKGKSKLKRHKLRKLYFSSFAAAASLIILFGLFSLLKNDFGRDPDFITVNNCICVNKINKESIKPIIKEIKSTPIIYTAIENDFAFADEREVISLLKPKRVYEVSLDGDNFLLAFEMRFDASIEFFFSQIQEDLDYYRNWTEYQEQTFLEKVAYHVKNSVVVDDNYIEDEKISLRGVAEKGVDGFNLLTNSDVDISDATNEKLFGKIIGFKTNF